MFPGAPDLDTYWQNILGKHDAVSDPPPGEWDPKLFYDPNSKSNDRVYCKKGGYLADLATFKPFDYGIMPVTVDGGEPDQWLALRVTHEALADAGYKESPKEHIRTEVILGKGTYVNRGNLTVGYHCMLIEHFLQALKNLHPEHTEEELLAIKNEVKAGMPPFSADTAPALIGNIIAGRVANRLDLMGSSFTVDAACASALLAMQIGVQDLLSRKCDLVLAGGVNVNAPLPTISLFCQLGALSRREQIRPFDHNADGTLLGEGLGVVVLKRLEDAKRDGNRIYAVVKAVGSASDGRAVHVLAPRVEGEELAVRRAYDLAGVSPDTVGLIEAHGTATPVGDVVEIQALRRVFGERRSEAPPSCAVGSVKSMIGHTMPAAGIAGVIKTALALYHQVLPPTLNVEKPNPALHLEETPFYINTETRPWIHGHDTPRRAGVNSFGFGGANAHVVLEEYTGEQPHARSHQLQWDSEVAILEAESRPALIERARRLGEFLASTADKVALKDLAYTLNCRLERKPCRLAVVATSLADLAQKLMHAVKRLNDPACKQIKDSNGIFFFDKPFEGKLAFVFPGEGAQYPNMLLDLCVHFPEVRQWFDLADRALGRTRRSILPSDFIFPRSIVPEADREIADKTLWQIDGAVEGVVIANQAMCTLLSRLEIRPDAIAGHSTGDYSAMLASNIFELTGESYIETIVKGNQSHARLASKIKLPESMLVAVAADSATVMAAAEASGGSQDLYLAMDNCPHQSVLVGTRVAAERVIEHLRRQGIIYEILPFDRPYHTPMFQAYAEAADKDFFAQLPIRTPSTVVYSCTTADRYPSDVEEIRKLFVAQTMRPVLFTQTVKKMYDDGVRIFVEAGPRGNLTAFVSDILRSKPHLAMPANVARRSGITQLNHLVGVLAAQGVGMRLDYLYARRDPKAVDWEGIGQSPQAKKQPRPLKLELALPPLKVAPRPPKAASSNADKVSALPQRVAAQPMPPPPAAAQPHERAVSPRLAVAELRQSPTQPSPVAVQPRPVAAPLRPVPVAASAVLSAPRVATAAQTQVMQNYFKGMNAFLETETQVMAAFFNRVRAPKSSAAPVQSPQPFPLLGNIVAMVPGQELRAERQLTLDEDLFLRDHSLAGPVSFTDPELRAMVVLPLTMSMEILAEAAAVLMPGQVLVGMRDILGRHWIRVDDSPVQLEISARRSTGSPSEVLVQIRNLSESPDRKGPAVIEGIVIFGEQYPSAPPASRDGLKAERPSRLAGSALYGRLMFHGPAFQAVAAIERSGDNGTIGQLRTLATDNMFRSVSAPRFVIDPVVLDGAGQLLGFWTAENLPRGFVVFPYGLKSLRVFGPNRPTGAQLTGKLIVELQGQESTRSDIEIAGTDGRVWMRLEGWGDRRFDPPPSFHQAWVDLYQASISQAWPAPLERVPSSNAFECYRLQKLFEPGASLWKELWASLVLTRRERQFFRNQRASEEDQLRWLSGRTVAKDALRSFLRKHHDLDLLPADIEIVEDEGGRMTARGAWTPKLRAVPYVIVSQARGLSDAMAVALVGEDGHGPRIGIDLQPVRTREPEHESSVLSLAEQRLLHALPQSLREEWRVRLSCAKTAMARVFDRAAIDRERDVEIIAVDTQTGIATARLATQPDFSGELTAYTMRDGEFVVATALYDGRTA
jgi:acyl transferase domain-containing protein